MTCSHPIKLVVPKDIVCTFASFNNLRRIGPQLECWVLTGEILRRGWRNMGGSSILVGVTFPKVHIWGKKLVNSKIVAP